ncbi:hypothetical protein [Streptomyces decoyicus]|uniref:hypothetical protein n=1 Tax=Streptomyces decoyicus TaxID=249567 RepID=UPI0033AC238F
MNALLVVVGTLATGAGPHAGDSSAVHRIPINWTLTTSIHGAWAVTVFGIAGFLLPLLARKASDAPAKRRRSSS